MSWIGWSTFLHVYLICGSFVPVLYTGIQNMEFHYFCIFGRDIQQIDGHSSALHTGFNPQGHKLFGLAPMIIYSIFTGEVIKGDLENMQWVIKDGFLDLYSIRIFLWSQRCIQETNKRKLQMKQLYLNQKRIHITSITYVNRKNTRPYQLLLVR